MGQLKYCSVLTIAGSDSSGGAGIQADLKTFAAWGCYGTSVITAVTCQNTLGVSDIHEIPSEIVYRQAKAVLEDINISAIKIGMIPNGDVGLAVAAILKEYPEIPVILDPVMVSSSGKKLMSDDAVNILKNQLFPLALLVTPNLHEAEFLSGIKINNIDVMKQAGKIIRQLGSKAVLIKGGHLIGNELFDVLTDHSETQEIFPSEYIQSHNMHGTGCTLSSAIASYLALGLELKEAILKAKEFVHQAILQGADVQTGKGVGPLNHFFDPRRMIKRS